MIETDIHAQFCRNFGALRRASGKTQNELADALGVSQACISYIENGRNCPTLNTVARLAEALGVSTDDLLSPHTERLLKAH